MARGRMINSAICADKRINELCDDTSRLAFTWLVTFADVEGRTYGDPALLRSQLFPRRTDITAERMEEYIREWAAAGLVIWYEAKDDLWIEFPAFEKNQIGLRKDREPGSEIPAPEEGRIKDVNGQDEVPSAAGTDPEHIRQTSGSDPAECRQDAGSMPEEIRPKRREEKRREGKVRARAIPRNGSDNDPQNTPDPTSTPSERLFQLVHEAGITVTQMMAQEYEDLLSEVDISFLELAFQEAERTNSMPVPRWLRKVIDRCAREQCRPGEWPGDNGHARASPDPPPQPPPDEEMINPLDPERVAKGL